MTGRLYGVGLGPGDPDLVTVRAARLIEAAQVVAYFSGPKGSSIARSIAKPYLRPGVCEELLRYPVTTAESTHADGYYGEIEAFYDQCAERLAAHLRAGLDVVVLAEGDPLFYGSYMYLHDRLAGQFPAAIVPGVTSVSGATSALARGLCRHEDVLTVLPGTLPVPELAWRLAQSDAAVVMKLGRTFAGVREALRQAGRTDDAWYVERATFGAEKVLPVDEVDATKVPYFAMVVVPGSDRRADSAGRHATTNTPAEERGTSVSKPPPAEERGTSVSKPPPAEERGTSVSKPPPAADPSRLAHAASSGITGRLRVIGLGPGPADWLTAEASRALGEVTDVFGYAPYVERVPPRPGLRRHPSGNTVEVERARAALDAALAGGDIAIVSGGDAGVFGMAAAVFEAAADPAYDALQVEILPGVSAAQAVAARAGAPLGGDFAMISLSDRLKPWPVVAQRIRAAGAADLVLAFYNPRSRTRPDQLRDALAVLGEVRPAETVVVVGRDVGRVEESLTVTTLGELDPASVDMKCLLIVGATGTRVTPAGRVWTPRFVPEG